MTNYKQRAEDATHYEARAAWQTRIFQVLSGIVFALLYIGTRIDRLTEAVKKNKTKL